MTLLRSLFLAGLVLFISTASAFAADTLADIAARIEHYPVVHSEFVQTKTMAALKRPLVTSGRLTYSRQHGVLWQIDQPFRMSYVLGEDRIVEIGSDGVRRERGIRDVPGLAQVGRVFRAMLGANTAALQEYFDVGVQGDVGQWEIELKPRQAQLAQFLTGMHFSGARFVESIKISEAGGDVTQIQFRNTREADVPGEEDLKLFGRDGAGSVK